MTPATAGTTGSVSLRGITKRYGRQVAVDDLSIEVEAGEFLTLLGPSGCGKTTTLRTIAGLEQPDQGSVLIDGRDVTRDPANIRPVNTVFQSYALFPHLSVYENVAFGLRRRKVEPAEIERLVGAQIDMMALHGYENRRPYQLSGGEQQRVALARALVLKPAVLLLDEPFASLDFKLRQRLQIELKSLQRETGISFVMVTHDQNEALAMSDRVAVMNKGRVDQLGDPIEVYQRPATPFVASFLGDANLLDAQAVTVDGRTVTAEFPDGTRVQGTGTGAAACAAGRPVQVFVRPEDVVVTADGAAAAAANAVTGSVEATVIVGGLDRKLLVRLGNGTIIESLVRAGAGDVATGTRVRASWPVEKTLVYGHRP
jgi:ABC-type Fe3+/spermidine/putrescine transport system ATPase subunit